MAKESKTPILNISKDSQQAIVSHIRNLVLIQQSFTEFHNRLTNLDYAYYLYRQHILEAKCQNKTASQIEQLKAQFDSTIETPIALSQVDSTVAYLTSLYLSGYPMFGIVSSKEYQDAAEQLEAIIDSHSIRGRWGREFIRLFTDAGKYNITAIENNWSPISNFKVSEDITSTLGTGKIQLGTEYINRLKTMDMYNMVWDFSKSPGDVAEFGEYVGYHEYVRKSQLKTDLIIASMEGEAYNIREAMASKPISGYEGWYTEKPIISAYLKPVKLGDFSWDKYAKNLPQNPNPKINRDYSEVYLRTVMYLRIIPSEFGLKVPSVNTPQIWKAVIINGSYLVTFKRVISPFNMFPILMGQLVDDGFDYQTPSIVENAIPWQDATTELLNIRLSSARRAISDRAIYNPDLLDPHDVNSSTPAPKIPLKSGLKGEALLSNAYREIPFDMSGTAGTISDMQSLMSLNEFLYGINSFKQGVTKKGNRTLGEYSDIQSNSDDRSRVMAIRLETQIFIPLKFHIKSNILTYGANEDLVRQADGKSVSVNMSSLREAVMDFKVSDGLNPKSRIVNTDLLMTALQFLTSNPEINQEYSVIDAFNHMMSLGGVPNMNQYKRTQPLQPAQPQEQPGNATGQ